MKYNIRQELYELFNILALECERMTDPVQMVYATYIKDGTGYEAAFEVYTDGFNEEYDIYFNYLTHFVNDEDGEEIQIPIEEKEQFVLLCERNINNNDLSILN